MSTNSFNSDREAKEFLVGKIVAEAEREGVALSDVERKMLYFSEEGWTLPDIMQVNADFERDYDEGEYERKIAGLIRRIEARGSAEDRPELVTWGRAVEKLREADHYLLCLIDSDFPTEDGAVRAPHDRLRLWLTAIIVVMGLFALIAGLNWMFGPRLGIVTEWLFEGPRYRGQLLVLGVVAVIALFNWRFGPKFRGALDWLLNRK